MATPLREFPETGNKVDLIRLDFTYIKGVHY